MMNEKKKKGHHNEATTEMEERLEFHICVVCEIKFYELSHIIFCDVTRTRCLISTHHYHDSRN